MLILAGAQKKTKIIKEKTSTIQLKFKRILLEIKLATRLRVDGPMCVWQNVNRVVPRISTSTEMSIGQTTLFATNILFWSKPRLVAINQHEESNLSIGIRLIEHTKQPINSTHTHQHMHPTNSLSVSMPYPIQYSKVYLCTQFVHRFKLSA